MYHRIFVADAADIVSGATLLHMTSNFAPHDKIVCNLEQLSCGLWSIGNLLHICNVELLVIAPHDKFTMYAVLS